MALPMVFCLRPRVTPARRGQIEKMVVCACVCKSGTKSSINLRRTNSANVSDRTAGVRHHHRLLCQLGWTHENFSILIGCTPASQNTNTRKVMSTMRLHIATHCGEHVSKSCFGCSLKSPLISVNRAHYHTMDASVLEKGMAAGLGRGGG